MNHLFICVVLIVLQGIPFVLTGQVSDTNRKAKLQLTYVGNEGIIIQGGGQKVLIDGLHSAYKPAYQHLDSEQLKKAVQGLPPFDRIDFILISHHHRDHFDPYPIGRYLLKNSETILISSQQVNDTLKKKFAPYYKIKDRVLVMSPPSGGRKSYSNDRIDIQILGLDHINKRFDWIQNLGFLITIKGNSLLHLGDAAMDEYPFQQLGLSEDQIDVACLPYWFYMYESGQSIIRKNINAKAFVALHVDPRNGAETRQEIQNFFPLTEVFTTLFSSVHYPIE